MGPAKVQFFSDLASCLNSILREQIGSRKIICTIWNPRRQDHYGTLIMIIPLHMKLHALNILAGTELLN